MVVCYVPGAVASCVNACLSLVEGTGDAGPAGPSLCLNNVWFWRRNKGVDRRITRRKANDIPNRRLPRPSANKEPLQQLNCGGAKLLSWPKWALEVKPSQASLHERARKGR